MVDNRRFVPISLTPRARNGFLKRVEKGGHNECWPFKGKLSNKRYGIVKSGRHDLVASRVAWFVEHDEQPAGVVCHKCDNPVCCNPSHLFVGTASENLLDMVAKGRCPNRQKKHCKRGHPLTFENTSNVNAKGRRSHRRCLACRRHSNPSRPVIPPEVVRELKRMRGTVSQRKLAAMFGISPSSVCRIQVEETPHSPRYSRWTMAVSPQKFGPTLERLRREFL